MIDIFIYKITNTINGKVYIGQTIRTIEQRFNRHISDAINCKLDTHFARAIRKYGKSSFTIEQIDSANTQEELNAKEQYWIKYYDSVNSGYNETDALYKCGGNTYSSKTNEDMKKISNKIRLSKLGSSNPNSKEIKCLNIYTKEELYFDTVEECRKYFEEKTHRFITTRVTGKTKSLYRGVWNIAYKDELFYAMNVHPEKPGITVLTENLSTNYKSVHKSIRAASKYTGISKNLIQKRKETDTTFIIDNYKFTILD